MAQTAMLFRVMDGNGRHARNYPVRGIPDAAVSNMAITPFGQVYRDKVKDYMDKLGEAGWAIRFTDPPSVNAKNPIRRIYSGGVGVNLYVEMAADPGYSAGNIVQIAGIRSNKLIRGRYKWIPVPATNLTWQLAKTENLNANLFNEGTVQLVTYSLATIGKNFFDRLAIKKTGRPFLLFRGKGSSKIVRG
jgi:hypothetical protein